MRLATICVCVTFLACADVSGLNEYEVEPSGSDGGAGGEGGAAPDPVCGDGILNGVEQCDDGNADDRDGCTNACVVECPMGWSHETNNHCYQLQASLFRWAQAASDCDGLGAHLATATTEAEIATVRQLSLEPAWLGAQRVGDSVDFGWITQEPFDYVNNQPPWLAGEPNNQNGIENCLEVVGQGLLNDLGCNQQRRFVCEISPAGALP